MLDELEVDEAEREQCERAEHDGARDAETELEPAQVAFEVAELGVAHR